MEALLLAPFSFLAFVFVPFLLPSMISAIRSAVARLYVFVGTHVVLNSSFPFAPPQKARGLRRGAHEQCRLTTYRGGGAAAAEEERDGCIVCLSAFTRGEEIAELGCGHVFHRQCLDQWCTVSGGTCPFCRRPVAVQAAKERYRREGGTEVEVEVEDGIVIVFPFSPCSVNSTSLG